MKIMKRKVEPVKVARFGGFPLRETDEDASLFRHDGPVYMYLLGFCIVYVLTMVSFNVWMSLKGRGLMDMGRIAEEKGMSATDATASALAFFPNFCGMLIFAIRFYKMGPLVTDFCQRFRELKAIKVSEGELKEIYDKCLAKIWCLYGTLLLSAMMATASFASFFIADVEWGFMKVSFYFMYFFSIVIAHFPLISCACFAITNQVLKSTVLALEKFKEILVKRVEDKETIDEIPHSEIEIFLETGSQLLNLISSLNQMLGPPLTYELSMGVLTLSISLFFTVTAFTAFEKDEINWLILGFSTANLLQFVFAEVRTSTHWHNGQDLCDASRRVKRGLQIFYSTFFWSFDKDQQSRIELITDKFDPDPQAPIRPQDLFDLRSSTKMSLGGICLTYMIVLLQFKFDGSDDNLAMNNTNHTI